LNLRPGFLKNEGSDKVKEPTIDRDEQILSNELPDAALEIAAAKSTHLRLHFLLGLGHLPCTKIYGADQ
jgi:hypothetical protein